MVYLLKRVLKIVISHLCILKIIESSAENVYLCTRYLANDTDKLKMTAMKNDCLRVALVLVGWLLLSSCHTSRLQVADLLFHVSAEPNAITEVTPGMIDHVAIYLGGDSVIEAVGKGVVITPLDSLFRQDGYYLAGRTSTNKKTTIARSLTFLGRAYDYLYLPDNEEIYCSELVQRSYVDKKGNLLFSTIPMSFHDNTGSITSYWRDFYARHGMDVPEGEPGTNPAELSQRDNVKLLGRLEHEGGKYIIMR